MLQYLCAADVMGVGIVCTATARNPQESVLIAFLFVRAAARILIIMMNWP